MTVDSGAIWEELRDRLRAFTARRVREPSDVDDVVQEVFLRIHRRLHTLRRGERLEAWVYQIARNAIADHYRSAAARRETPAGHGEDLAGVEAEATSPAATEASSREIAACLAPMIERLPAAYREAIALTEREGITQQEAARRTGVSVSGMKSRVQRARRQLKQMLLDCCHVALDRRGGVVEYAPRARSCGICRGPERPG